ncbi:hypothetical protein NWP17_01730 [Chrysosporum bergii ANA360D]|uniref:Transmembrane protein n=1 Tax=Chrysosporum bergii ANA360D TaxID=617107 RepID=A0AA43KAF9_9CYAN|nr:hypothetical protein [Chrysosporum bergii]MDH6059173.1 hypothetical protein [Chrysosporum bergii ANA360D]
MHSINFMCHEFVVAVSFFACIAGLLLLWERNPSKDHLEETEKILFRMSFSYWLVYCFAFGVEKLIFPDWETILMSVKITTALSYFLTFSCVLSLPLHKISVRRVQE